MRKPAVLLAAALLLSMAVAVPTGAASKADAPRFSRPTSATCAALRPSPWAPATGTSDRRGDLRVIGIQYKQVVANVATYDAFRTAMRCQIEDFVVPLLVPGRPTLVVFNEDIGLMTLALGRRGAAVLAQAGTPL
ncbi:MAG: Glycerophosphoryl diester phosphodiesterase, partial [Frankiales bacterium]|nr:Glycerophosphoryl diester phosphodiesterase [Frankiales bacterium]